MPKDLKRASQSSTGKEATLNDATKIYITRRLAIAELVSVNKPHLDIPFIRSFSETPRSVGGCRG